MIQTPIGNVNISGTVFDDTIPYVGGATITLSGLDLFDTPITLATITDTNGMYAFPNSVPGYYDIFLTVPATHHKDTSDASPISGGLGSIQSGAIDATDIIGHFLLTGSQSTGNDFVIRHVDLAITITC